MTTIVDIGRQKVKEMNHASWHSIRVVRAKRLRMCVLTHTHTHTHTHISIYTAKVSHFLHWFPVNVWCSIIRNCVMWPYVTDGCMAAAYYLNFLQNSLQDIPLWTRLRLLFQHEGAPPHVGWKVTKYLTHHCPNCWTGHSGPCAWPVRSSYRTTLYYYLWEHMKSMSTRQNCRQERNYCRKL